jgi:uncharacterized protein (TIGR00725 family)
MNMTKWIIGVIGGGNSPDQICRLAEEVGTRIAEGGAILICGGLGGVMEFACKGAKGAGGTTIGVLPGTNKDDANEHVDIPIATGMSIARNAIITHTADILIAIDGEYGTLSEIGFALNLNKPVIALQTWYLETAGKVDDELFFRIDDAKEAVDLAFKLLSNKY